MIGMIGIIELLIIIAIIGLIAWALIQLVPMPDPIKTVIVIVAVLFCLPLVLRSLSGLDLAIAPR